TEISTGSPQYGQVTRNPSGMPHRSIDDRCDRMPPIRIGIIGDFEPAYHSHFATNAALYDAAARLKMPVELRWVPTPALDASGAEKILRRSHGLVASPGSPYKCFAGMLRGIEFAR